MAKPKKPDPDFLPEIRRVRLDRLTIYEVSEEELETLARGSVESTLFNFAVFTGSAFISFLVALLSTTIPSDRTFTVFVVITVVSGLASALLFVVWFFTRKSGRVIIRRIKDRLPPQGIQQPGGLAVVDLPPAVPDIRQPRQLADEGGGDAGDATPGSPAT